MSKAIPQTVTHLIEQFSRLPGIGPKSASRLTYYLLRMPDEQAEMLAEAILALKQGVGRLIRAETDRGVIAILDSRVNTKRYGPQVIASLPRARRTLRFEDVVAFFA